MVVGTKIQRWGNSQGIRFPKRLFDALGLGVGDEVEIRFSDDEITVRPAVRKRPRHKFEDLVRRMPKGRRLTEESWGRPRGREAW